MEVVSVWRERVQEVLARQLGSEQFGAKSGRDRGRVGDEVLERP